MLVAKHAHPSKNRRYRLPPKLATALGCLKGSSSPWAVILLLLSLLVVRGRIEPAFSLDVRRSSEADSDLEFAALALDNQPRVLPESVPPQPLALLTSLDGQGSRQRQPGTSADSKSQRDPVYKPFKVTKPYRPPIVDAPVISVGEVKDQVNDNELVLGVVVGGEARAYPINMLTGPSREIINDTLGGRAIAATW